MMFLLMIISLGRDTVMEKDTRYKPDHEATGNLQYKSFVNQPEELKASTIPSLRQRGTTSSALPIEKRVLREPSPRDTTLRVMHDKSYRA